MGPLLWFDSLKWPKVPRSKLHGYVSSRSEHLNVSIYFSLFIRKNTLYGRMKVCNSDFRYIFFYIIKEKKIHIQLNPKKYREPAREIYNGGNIFLGENACFLHLEKGKKIIFLWKGNKCNIPLSIFLIFLSKKNNSVGKNYYLW